MTWAYGICVQVGGIPERDEVQYEAERAELVLLAVPVRPVHRSSVTSCWPRPSPIGVEEEQAFQLRRRQPSREPAVRRSLLISEELNRHSPKR